MHARRITGPHPFLPNARGALCECRALDQAQLDRLQWGLLKLGWGESPVVYTHAQGWLVGVGSPPDLTDAAADLVDWALQDGSEAGWQQVLQSVLNSQNPAVRAILNRFPDRAFIGEELLTVGLGVYASSWPVHQPPDPDSIGIPGRIPVAMITGTNGKTTTTRLLAHLARQAKVMPGWTSSGGVLVGDSFLERGDWTGPGAARMVLRDRRVELAILETARGGILRRGLAIDGIDVAALTNVTQDHLGEWGVDSLEEMARVKLTIGWALKVGGTLIVPLESEPIAAALKPLLEKRPDIQLQTFSSTKPAHAWADERFLYANGGRLPLNELPFTFDGTARHNVENALTATLVALALGLSPGAISAGLRSFTASIHNNPGRMNSFRLPNGAIVVVDVAHTPDGIKRIVETLKHWPHSRSILLLGQTGDRPDSDLQGLAVEVARAGFQKIVLKEMPSKLYNRHLGEVSYVLKSTLMAAGVPPNRISGPVGDEISGVKQVLGGAIRGDLILILCHETLVGTLEVLNQVGAVAV